MTDREFEIDGIFLHQTEKAVMVEIENEVMAIPRNQLMRPTANELMAFERGDEATFVMTAWIAGKKNLI